MTPRLAIGLVGCGRWGLTILRDLTRLGPAVIAVDPSEEARARARDRGAADAVATLARLPTVAGVIVATPTPTHAAVIDALLDRRIPVFVEKPFTGDEHSADRLAGLAPDRLFVMHKWRYHPAIQELGRIARSGELGAVVGLRTTRLGWDGPHPDDDVVGRLVPHDLSIAYEVFGHIPAPACVRAEWVGGRMTAVTGVLGHAPWMTFEVAAASPDRRRDVRLACERGVAVLRDPFADHIEMIAGFDPSVQAVPSVQRRAVSVEPPLIRQLKAFVSHVAGGPPPLTSAAEGAAVVRALAQLRRMAGGPDSPHA